MLRHKTYVPMLLPVLRQAVADTSAHGVNRISSSRAWYVKTLWLVIFCVFLAFCFKDIVNLVQKFQRQEVSTVVFANQVPFEFPDLYFCLDKVVSSSKVQNLDQRNIDTINNISRRVETIMLKKNLNNSYRFVPSSIPYNIFSDNLGYQMQQFVVLAEQVNANDNFNPIEGDVFHHSVHLNCYRIQLSEEQKENLRDPQSSLSFIFLIDFYKLNNSKPGIPDVYFYKKGLKRNVSVFDWNLNGFDDFSESNVIKLFITAPNQYPDSFQTSVLLGSGRQYEIKLSMVDTVLGSGLDTVCSQNTVKKVEFLNPYNKLKPYIMDSGVSFCYHHQLAKVMSERLKCMAEYLPVPNQFSEFAHCNNLLSDNNSLDYQQLSEMKLQLYEWLQKDYTKLRKLCEETLPCYRRQYSSILNDVNWPSIKTFRHVVDDIMKEAVVDGKVISPLWKYIVDLYGVIDSESNNVKPRADQLNQYLEKPPLGLSPVIWAQAKAENPDPSRLIPVPVLGFGQLQQRMTAQEEHAASQQSDLQKVASAIDQVRVEQASLQARLEGTKRAQLQLGHRVVRLLCRQEVLRKAGCPMQPQEEQLRTAVDQLQQQLPAGRLRELASYARLGLRAEVNTSRLDSASLESVSEHLVQQQDAIRQLMAVVRDCVKDLDIVQHGITPSRSPLKS